MLYVLHSLHSLSPPLFLQVQSLMMVTASAVVGILGTIFAQQVLKKLQVSQGDELWIVDCVDC